MASHNSPLESICPVTGYRVFSKHEWQVDVPERNYRIAFSILGDRILKTEIWGYSTPDDVRQAARVLEEILEDYFNKGLGYVQIFDIKNHTGFTAAARKAYRRSARGRKNVLGHIFYNTSLLFNIILKIGRRLNRSGYGLHIVNDYKEAVTLAEKLFSTRIPTGCNVQLDTISNVFKGFNAESYCPFSYLPVMTKPEWTDVVLGKSYSATFKIIGRSILLSQPRGKSGCLEIERFMDIRARVVEEAFGPEKPFVEIKDYTQARTPTQNTRHTFYKRMKQHEHRLAAFIAYNTPLAIRFSFTVGKQTLPMKCPYEVVPDYKKAVTMAVSALNAVMETGRIPRPSYFSGITANNDIKAYTPLQIDHYINEMLLFLGDINWEIDGLETVMENIPSDHPFGLVFEAFSLIKSDLDMLSRERRDAIKALAKSEKLYRLLAENAMDVIWTTDLNKNPVYYSPSACPLTGYSIDELMGAPLGSFLTEESEKKITDLLNTHLELERKGVNLSRAALLFELENIHKTGFHYFTEVKVSFIRNTDGQPAGIIGVTRDITERKKAEAETLQSRNDLKSTRDKLIQSEKMAALGSLVAGVSHEISTPLGISVTASSFLLKKIKDMDKKKHEGELLEKDVDVFVKLAMESVTMISDNLNRAAELINSFKQISVDQGHEMKRNYNLKNYTQSVLQSLAPRFKHSAFTLDVQCDEHIMVDGYPGALSQIITNLVMNSLIHGFDERDPGRITLRMWESEGHIYIEFTDDGKGMDSHTVRQVFDPFFTTRRALGGSGLGLHIVYNIVTGKLKGEITCQSSPGEGATFLIHFPH